MQNPFCLLRLPPTVNRSILKLVGFVVGGAALGLAYQHFVGCRTGTCPITSNPYISTAYGALIGYLASGGWKSRRRPEPPPEPAAPDPNQGI